MEEKKEWYKKIVLDPKNGWRMLIVESYDGKHWTTEEFWKQVGHEEKIVNGVAWYRMD